MTDWQLLQDYAERGSETAFESLVHRHVDMVHATALRQVRDPDLAQDVTQAVFILLARKAARLRRSVILGGWLYRTATLVARRAIRTQLRQQRREREAIAMLPETSPDELWELLSPHLDAAIQELGATDRDAVVLRYLQQRSLREVADALGVSEDAAKKRVARALEKLRTRLARRGATVTALTLGAALTAKASPAAPVAVASAAIKSGLTAGAGALASTTALHLAGGVARDWLLTKLKWGLAALAATSMVLLFQARVLGTRAKPSSAPTVAAVGAAGPADSPSGLGATTNAVAAPKRRGMTFWIVEAGTGMPLAGAVGRITFYGPKYLTSDLAADFRGAMPIVLPDRRFGGMAVRVAAAGHVPEWSSWQNPDEAQLPQDYTLKLQRGGWAGGRVVNAEGQPVGGVRVRFNGEGLNLKSREYVDYWHPMNTLTTGPHGEWAADFLAPRDQGDVWGRLTHPNYAETEFRFRLDAAQQTNLTLTIQRGARVTGVLKNAAGQPIQAAQVTVDWPHEQRDSLQVRSDQEGRFVFQHVTPGRFLLSASADGYGAFQNRLDLPASGLDVPLTLAALAPPLPKKIAGHSTVRGRVVDEAGKPIADVSVSLGQGQPALEGVQWSAQTDDAGRFAWTEAPEGKVRLHFSSYGFYEDSEAELAADGTEHVVPMKAVKTVEVRCHVTDKSTGGEIEKFKVLRGDAPHFNSEEPETSLNSHFEGEGKDGLFFLQVPPNEVSRPWLFQGVQVQAEGYLDQVVELRANASNRLDLEIALERAKDLFGTVLAPDGAPAEGAQVALAGKAPGQSVQMQQPARLLIYWATQFHHTTTSSDGAFRLAPQPGGERLVIMHDQGSAIVPLASLSPAPIRLVPWGRIEGVLRIGASGGANQKVAAQSAGAGPVVVTFFYDAQADATGRFRFEKVPPGNVRVSRYIEGNPGGAGPIAFSQTQSIEVRPGETTQVVLDAQGVRVKGCLRVQPARGDIAWHLSPQNLRAVGSADDSGKSASDYGFFCRPDGTFEVEGVPPGACVLEAQAEVIGDPNNPDFGIPVGHRTLDFVIPEGTEKEFDLGEVVVPVQGK